MNIFVLDNEPTLAAQAMLNISEGIKNGKVQTIVVPSNFNALIND